MIACDPLGAAIALIGAAGVCGVFLLALGERLFPLVPSAGLFTAIGAAAAEGLWCLPAAAIVSVLGSSAGVVGTYHLGSLARQRLSGPRLRRMLRRRDRRGRMLRAARRSAAALPFTSQLMPTARILAPLFAGAVPHNRTRFLLATGAGLAAWNIAFIGLGYGLVSASSPLAPLPLGLS
ncbi:hypothetical protein COC42_12005 [Sphingomonas spermidinifaciens]|uniref:VTT domain-containing protein n=1 Tax=Sphingomonas spermidinifaciens TaxID=1141889 RepID=A0A2A4AZ13_9SPHN|nr:VTT domain-containing protein [Sphingomonas spermidinifaciens]PCD02183.1 hypothetical protein COC42_12005 [Sphingomonas spermidinifaciens]